MAKSSATKSTVKPSRSYNGAYELGDGLGDGLTEETGECDSFDFQVLNSLSRSQFKDFSLISPAPNLEGTPFVRIVNHKNQPVIVKKAPLFGF